MTRSRSRINTLSRAGRRGVFRRRQMVLHGRAVGTPALRRKRRQEHHPPAGRPRPSSAMTRDASNSTAPCRSSGAPRSGWACPVVVREAMYGTSWSPVIPAFFADCPAFQARQRRGEGLRLAQLPLPDAQRPLLPAGGNPGLNSEQASLTKPDCRSPWERRARARCRGRRRGTTSTSTTGFCGCRRQRDFSRR